MMLTSSSFEDKQEIPRRHGKKAGNVSPALSWDDPPPGTRSFALVMVDRHPVAQDYVHWLVTDIGADTMVLPEGAADGAMPAGSSEVSPYAGPLPPSGTHDYEVTVYALDTDHVEVPRGASFQQFVAAVEPYTLDVATMLGSFTA
ncbi:MAG TPA: YbhB/YbcL family Raf kinase inhibitor-like protein [Micromonosporaceae bacterium]|jgi:hypothetical protein